MEVLKAANLAIDDELLDRALHESLYRDSDGNYCFEGDRSEGIEDR